MLASLAGVSGEPSRSNIGFTFCALLLYPRRLSAFSLSTHTTYQAVLSQLLLFILTCAVHIQNFIGSRVFQRI